MAAEEKQTILIVEDDLDVADMLNAYFRVQGYNVITANWGEDGLKSCQAHLPNLVILDIRLPDIDGFEVARQLRTNRKTEHIPIIFLTEKRARSDRLKGLELGADDYLTKPFDIQELRLRVRNALRRAAQGAINNPITGLPEGEYMQERLASLLGQPQTWGLILVSLENLDAFREAYGFIASDDVLRAVSMMLQNSLRDLGGEDDLIGHLDKTSFLLITRVAALADLANRIRSRMDQSLDYFYPIKARETETPSENRLHIRVAELASTQVPGKADGDTVLKSLRRQLK